MYSLSETIMKFLHWVQEGNKVTCIFIKNYVILSLGCYELKWRNVIITFCAWMMNFDHCSFYEFLKFFYDWITSQRKYILYMTAALYFKWQYTKVHLSQTGKRPPDSDGNDHSLKASSNQQSWFIHATWC